MKKNHFHFILLTTLLLPVVNDLDARVVVQHLGANDPVDQGFIPSTDAITAEVGPVFNDFGKDAWSIHTRSGMESGRYRYWLSAHDVQDAFVHGWELSATMRLLESQHTSTSLSFLGPDKSYILNFSFAMDGGLQVSTSSTDHFRIDSDPHAYHQFTIRYDSLTELTSLWIEGSEVDPNIFSYPGSSSHFLQFGTSQGMYHSHWHEVSFTIVPEPKTAVLLTGLCALLAAVGWRWRRMGAA